jgi:hypothetical protein
MALPAQPLLRIAYMRAQKTDVLRGSGVDRPLAGTRFLDTRSLAEIGLSFIFIM